MSHKLGIIGFGGMAEYHYGTVKREDIGIEPVAVFDVRPERRERAVELGMKAYETVEEFLADGSFDLVLVATSNNHHMRYTCMAMEHGYNVICEKPAAMNASEVEQMIETSEKTGKFFTIHQNRRFDRDFRMIKKTLDSGIIGTPYLIESRIMSPDGSGCMYNWRGMKDHGGGMLPDWGVHMLDQLLWLNNDKKVKSVYAVIRSVASEEVDDYSKVIINFEGGLVCHVEVVTYSPATLPRWIVEADLGGASMQDMGDGAVKVRKIGKQHTDELNAYAYPEAAGFDYRKQNIRNIDSFEELDVDDSGVNSDWGSIYKNIRNVLDGKEELFVKPAEVLRCMKVIDAAFESAQTGNAVFFE